MKNPFSLSSQRVLVVGAAGGIGAETARIAAAAGARVLLMDRQDCGPLEQELTSLDHEVQSASCDIADRDAVESTIAGFGDVDAMVVCSAISPFDDWLAPEWDEQFERVMAINVRGTVNCVRAVMPGMQQRKRGRIVLVGSIAGQMGGISSTPHYVASKGGIHSLVKWFARLGAPDNVLVNGVAPGGVLTPMIANHPMDVSRVPLGRLAQPEEIAGPLVFLCSPASSYFSGAILSVNGGAFLG